MLKIALLGLWETWSAANLVCETCSPLPDCCVAINCFCLWECNYCQCYPDDPLCNSPVSTPEKAYSVSDNYIFLKLKPSKDMMIVGIYSVSGKPVFFKSYSSTSSTFIDISKLKEGIYIIQVYIGGRVIINDKFIKK